MKKDPTKGYISLDTLLDTHMGLLAKESPEWIPKLLEAGYRDRVSDDFTLLVPDFPQFWFDCLYKNRDVSVLRYSRPRSTLALIRKITNTLEDQVGGPFMEQVEIDVNIHPYVLSEPELTALHECVSYYCGVATKVNIIDFSLERLTPSFVKQSYGGVIMYDLMEWITTHSKELEHCKMPTITFYTPRIYRGTGVPTAEDLTPRGTTDACLDCFAEMEQLYAEWFGFSFHPARLFSLIDINDFETPKEDSIKQEG